MRRRQVSRTQTTSLARRFAPVTSKKYFLPTSIAGCQLWLDAADSSSIVKTGTNVTAWRDKSGNGYHMDTITPNASWSGTAAYPTIGTPINGLQTLNFSSQAGLKQSLTLDGVKNLFWIGRIAAPTGTAAGGAPIYFLLGHDSNYDWHGSYYGQRFIDGSNSQGGIYGATGSLFTSDANAVTNATFGLMNMPSAPSISLLSVTGITGTTRYQGICYDRTTHTGWCGDLAEVIIFSSALTTAQRQAVEGYLAHKWGLTKYYSPSFPLSISGCQLWLDAADATTVSAATYVSQWRDKSGNNRHFGVRSDGTTYSSNAIKLNGSCMFVDSPVDLTKVTVFILAKTISGGNQTVLTTRSNTGTSYNSTDGFGFYMDGTTSMRFFGTYPAGSSFAVDTSTPKLFSFQSSGTSISAWYNGVSQVGSTLASPRTSTARGFGIGGEWTNENGGGYQNFYVNASIYEIIVFNSDLKTTDRENIEKYLMQKWGLGVIPSTHPYVNFIPSPLVEFIPTSLSGCQLWLDGADTSSLILSGSSVTSFNDKSGNKYHMNALPGISYAGNSTYPTIGTSINRKNTLQFIPQAGLKQSTTLDGVKNLFWVGSVRAESGLYFLLGHDTYLDWCGDNYPGKVLNAGFVPSGILNASPVSIFSSDVTSAVTNATFSNVNMPAVSTPFLLSASGISGSSRYQGICYDRVTHIGWCGDLGEVIIFSTALTTEQRQQVEGYLALKWGLTGSLPSGHPYKSFSPYSSLTNTFLPTFISGCQLWLDAADKTSMTLSGSTVTQWKDKSGNGRNGTGAGTPTYSSSSFNGNPSITFSGSPQSFTGSLTNTSNTVTVFTVIKYTTFVGNDQRIVSLGVPGQLDYTNVAYCVPITTYGTTPNRLATSRNQSTKSDFGPITTGSSFLTSTVYNGTDGRLFVNGTLASYEGPNSSTENFGYTTYAIATGAGGQGSDFFRGEISEVIIYHAALNTTQRQQVESYLAWKWGLQTSLPSDHTYKFAPPSV